MRCLLLRLLALAALVLVATWAEAQSPVGRWVVDEDAMRGLMRGMVVEQLEADGVPPAQQEMILQAIEPDIARTLEELRGTLEFFPDGRAVFSDTKGRADDASWTQDGETIRIVPAEGEDNAMRARIIEGKLHLRSEKEGEEGLAVVFMRE